MCVFLNALAFVCITAVLTPKTICMLYVCAPCCMDALAESDLALKNHTTALRISKLHCVNSLPYRYTILLLVSLPYKGKCRHIGSSTHTYY